MAEIIDHMKEIIKNTPHRVMNTPEDMAQIRAINKHMEEVRREFKIKEALSWESASKTIFTA